MGFRVSRKRVARLMRVNGIPARQKRCYKSTTRRHPTHTAAPNLLAQDFSAAVINEKWLADITDIDTAEDGLYLAVIMAAYSRKIVGWSMSNRLHTKLVEDTLRMALGQHDIISALIHHSDQGSQYTSCSYRNLLTENQIVVSFTGSGNCYGHAMIESFFATLKTEYVIAHYSSRQQARQSIFAYIEVWYNRQRRHSALGYLSPLSFERLAA